MILIVVSELMLLAPVAEVSRKDEQGLLIVKVGGKHFPIVSSHLLAHWASQDWHYFGLVPDHLMDEGQLHFDAVLVLFIINVQHEEPFFLLELVNDLGVNI